MPPRKNELSLLFLAAEHRYLKQNLRLLHKQPTAGFCFAEQLLLVDKPDGMPNETVDLCSFSDACWLQVLVCHTPLALPKRRLHNGRLT